MSAGPDGHDLGELKKLAVDLARDAAALHVEGRRSVLSVATKSSPTDLVSQVDKASEELIVGRLREARPDDGVLAEEGALAHGTSGVRWVIDPLDGTTNYVYGYPAYAVSIAAEVDGRPRVGVVYDSSRGHLYEAVEGEGARRDGHLLRVNDKTRLATALVATGFSYDARRRGRQGDVAARVLRYVRDLRRAGSAALDLCLLAAGHLDAYWELDLSPWDYAAGGLIAREAGAQVVFPQPANERGPAVVAAPPALLPAFLDLLREAGALA